MMCGHASAPSYGSPTCSAPTPSRVKRVEAEDVQTAGDAPSLPSSTGHFDRMEPSCQPRTVEGWEPNGWKHILRTGVKGLITMMNTTTLDQGLAARDDDKMKPRPSSRASSLPRPRGAWLEAVARGWNCEPTPFIWGGKRQARRERARQRRHALGGSGAPHPAARAPTSGRMRSTYWHEQQQQQIWTARLSEVTQRRVLIEYERAKRNLLTAGHGRARIRQRDCPRRIG